MSERWQARLSLFLTWLCVAGALWFAGCFIAVALLSMRYPFQLEWMEGQFIDVVARVVSGKPIYTEPSIYYVSFPYTPYYFYVSAFVALFTGVDFFPARLVSFLAALGCSGVIYAWIRRERGDWKTALIAGGMFLATYAISGRWFDMARVDSLFLFLNLAGLFIFYFYRGRESALCAAAILAMAFFTKQTSAFLLLPPFCAMLWIQRRDALWTIGLWAAMVAGGIVALNYTSGGWFNFYAFELSAGHPIQKRYLLGFWTDDLLKKLGVSCIVAVGALWLLYKQDRDKALWYGALAAGFGGCSYAARLNWGGYYNTLMPAHAVLALLAGLFLVLAERRVLLRFSPVCIALQMGMLLYNPAPLIPSDVSRAQGENFLREIAAIDGEIFMPELQFVQTRIGKTSYDLGFPAMDVLWTDLGKNEPIKQKLAAELRAAIESRQFAALMPGRFLKLPEKRGFYKPDRDLEYPKEYVTGAVGTLRTKIFMPETLSP